MRAIQETLVVANAFFGGQLQDSPGASYLCARGIHQEQVRKYGLGYAPAKSNALMAVLNDAFGEGAIPAARRAGLLSEKDRRYYPLFRDRITFPIRDHHGVLVGFGSRRINAGPAKYMNTPETAVFKKSRILYGLYEALHAYGGKIPSILVVEGYLDVISLSGAGIGCAVSPMGVALTRGHAELMLRYTNEVNLCFDGDAAGWRGASRALPAFMATLKCKQRAYFTILPEGEDPDSLTRKTLDPSTIFDCAEILTIGQMLVRVVELELSRPDVEPNTWLHSIEGRATFLIAAKRYMAMAKDPDIYLLAAQSIGRRIGIETYRILDYMGSTPSPEDLMTDEVRKLAHLTHEVFARLIRGSVSISEFDVGSYDDLPALLKEVLRALASHELEHRTESPRAEPIAVLRSDHYFQRHPDALELLEDIAASPSLPSTASLEEALSLVDQVRDQAFEVRWQDLSARILDPEDEAALSEWQAMISRRAQTRTSHNAKHLSFP